jgi:hypothetical protein
MAGIAITLQNDILTEKRLHNADNCCLAIKIICTYRFRGDKFTDRNLEVGGWKLDIGGLRLDV